MSNIKLGNEVKDIVTGLVGITIARVEYLNGCVQFCVQPKLSSKGFADAIREDKFYIDEAQLEKTGDGILVKPTGRAGPSNHTPKGIGRT